MTKYTSYWRDRWSDERLSGLTDARSRCLSRHEVNTPQSCELLLAVDAEETNCVGSFLRPFQTPPLFPVLPITMARKTDRPLFFRVAYLVNPQVY